MTDNIEVYVQNSIRINSPQGLIYIDPFRMQELHNDAAFIFITHDHYDHYSPEDIDKVIGEHTILVIPVHYGEFVGKESDGDDFARSVNREIEVKFKIKF